MRASGAPGRRRWLKQVCAVGRRSECEPLREMTKGKLPSPLMGTRSLPVVKNSRRFLCSSESACTTRQKCAITGEAAVYPSS